MFRIKKQWQSLLADLFLLCIVVFYLLVCPYTKVEESFNVQATHDLMEVMMDMHGKNDGGIQHFDHLKFPGVVPRTFVGPVVVSTVAHVAKTALHSVGFMRSTVHGDLDGGVDDWHRACAERSATDEAPNGLQTGDLYWTVPGEWNLILSRLVLGVMSVASQWFLRRCISRKFGHNVGLLYTLFTACQFHLAFYMSRPLSNVFALVLVTLAIGYWMRGNHVHMFLLLGASATVFRCEVLALIAPIAAVCLLTGRISLAKGVLTGVASIVYSILFSAVVDTYFWQRVLWSEGEVLYFNTFMNKSHEWGTQPAHWYFTNALPRSMLFAYVLLPLGLWFHRTRHDRPSVLPYAASALAFVGLYSILPHKELRFIFYAIPLLNVTAAVGCVSLINRLSERWRSIPRIVLAAGLVASLAASQIFLLASHHNYFGAYALKRLYAMELKGSDCSSVRHVYMDSIATMNGVTRFLETKSPLWHFSKTGNRTSLQMDVFTHLLTDSPDEYNDKFRTIAVEDGFRRISLRKLALIDTEPKVFVMKRKGDTLQSRRSTEKETEESSEAEYGIGFSHGHGTTTAWFNEHVLQKLFPNAREFDKIQRQYLSTLSRYTLPPAVFAKFTTIFIFVVGVLFHISAIMVSEIDREGVQFEPVTTQRKKR